MRLSLVIAFVFLIVSISSVEAAKRVALVIGNDSYKTLTKLNNARKDAKDMAGKLKELGWEVILETDVGRRKMGRAIEKFGGLLANAEAGLVFYAGHGIQSKGENWLIPSNAEVETEGDLEYEAVALSKIMKEMEASGVNLNIVVLDACRDNPLPKRTRSATRGLSISPTPQGMKGTAIVYSAAPGQTAQDGPTGGNGIFTGELLNILGEPGLKLEDVFKKTAQQVAARTNNKQKPWINTSITGDFYFNEAVAPAAVTKKATPQQSAPKSSGGVTQDTKKKEEMLLWDTVKGSNDASMYEAYLQEFPKGTFATIARIKLKGLQKAKATEKAKVAALEKAEADRKKALKQNRLVTGVEGSELPKCKGSPIEIMSAFELAEWEWDNCKGTYNFSPSSKFAGDGYAGEWKNGKQHGQGTAYFANGDVYVGAFRNDKIQGQGTLTFANGKKYVGEFRNGIFDGKGTLAL